MTNATKITAIDAAIVKAGQNVKNSVFTLIATLAIDAAAQVNVGRIWTDKKEMLLTSSEHGVNMSPDYATRVVRMSKHVMEKVKPVIQPEAKLADNVKAVTKFLSETYTLASLRQEMSNPNRTAAPKEGPSKKDLEQQVAQLTAQLSEQRKAAEEAKAPTPKAPSKRQTVETTAAALTEWIKKRQIAKILDALDTETVNALAQALNARMVGKVDVIEDMERALEARDKELAA
jgi:hypothetical protein